MFSRTRGADSMPDFADEGHQPLPATSERAGRRLRWCRDGIGEFHGGETRRHYAFRDRNFRGLQIVAITISSLSLSLLPLTAELKMGRIPNRFGIFSGKDKRCVRVLRILLMIFDYCILGRPFGHVLEWRDVGSMAFWNNLIEGNRLFVCTWKSD